LSETRWSCRADATKAIVHGYEKIKVALADISQDQEQKDVVKMSQTLRYRNIYVGRPTTPSLWAGIGAECRLISGSTVAKLPVGLACH
jgi:hypothetical protein